MTFQTFINNIFIGAENIFNFINLTFVGIIDNNFFKLLLCILLFGIIIWIILLILGLIMNLFDFKFKEIKKSNNNRNLKEHE